MGNVVRGVWSRGKAGEEDSPEGETVAFCFLCSVLVLFTSNTEKTEFVLFFSQPLGSEEVVLIVLQDYPFNGVSEPTYRLGEKLRLLSQYVFFLIICLFHLKIVISD